MMLYESVSSSCIAYVGYDAETKTMRLTMNNGHEYEYWGVYEHVVQELILASSKGKYYNEHIKGRYDGEVLA